MCFGGHSGSQSGTSARMVARIERDERLLACVLAGMRALLCIRQCTLPCLQPAALSTVRQVDVLLELGIQLALERGCGWWANQLSDLQSTVML